MKPVSVIIPTYNRKEKLKLSVESVLNQTYQDLELIIVDDGSTDQTEEYVRSLRDERIRYHKFDTNKGVSAARNRGGGLAKNDIIAFHDSDDIWVKDKLQKQMDYWNDNKEYVLVYSAYTDWTGHRVPDSDDRDQLEGDIHSLLLCRNTIGAPTIVMRKDIFEKTGGFDEGLKALEDWDFVIRVAREGKIGFVGAELVNVTRSEGGISSSVTNYFDARCQMMVKYINDMNRYGISEFILTDILNRAERYNIVEQVKKMLLLYLS